MKRLIEFPLDQGGSIVVQVDKPPAGAVTRGFGKDRSALVEGNQVSDAALAQAASMSVVN